MNANKIIGFVVGAKIEMFANKKIDILEIRLERKDKKLLDWINKKVLVIKVE